MLNNEVDSCPNKTYGDSDEREITSPPLKSPDENPRFPPSLSLGTDDINALMEDHFYKIVGILGAPDAGKTAALVSLYLLLSHGKLEGFEFANSQTLMAFEQISRGARRWNDGCIPEQMTGHTQLADARSAGYLHLRLNRLSSGQSTDILLSDLPGEWSTDLINTNRTDRLTFLKSAEVIWLMVDGEQLLDAETKYHALHRATLLIQRISEFLRPHAPKLTIVITRLDMGAVDDRLLTKLKNDAAQYGLTAKTVQIASLSESDLVPAGQGIVTLVESVFDVGTGSAEMFWPDQDTGSAPRQFLRYRN